MVSISKCSIYELEIEGLYNIQFEISNVLGTSLYDLSVYVVTKGSYPDRWCICECLAKSQGTEDYFDTSNTLDISKITTDDIVKLVVIDESPYREEVPAFIKAKNSIEEKIKVFIEVMHKLEALGIKKSGQAICECSNFYNDEINKLYDSSFPKYWNPSDYYSPHEIF